MARMGLKGSLLFKKEGLGVGLEAMFVKQSLLWPGGSVLT